MKKYTLTVLLSSLFLLDNCAQKKYAIIIDDKDKIHQLSYYIGSQIGVSMIQDGYTKEDDFSSPVLAVGLQDGFSKSSKINNEEATQYLQAYKNKRDTTYEGAEKTFKTKLGEYEVTINFTKTNDLINYILGSLVGTNLVGSGFTNEDINTGVVAQAICDKVLGGEPRIAEETCQEAYQSFVWVKSGIDPEQAQKNKEEGIKFLEQNKNKEGVITLESGLQYKIIKQAEGSKPTATDKVKVHYHGTLIDGTVFDSSLDRNEPITFGLNRVIKGWTEGLQLMSIGSKYTFYIPSELAYGANPRPGSAIGPNMVLLFDVELLNIEK